VSILNDKSHFIDSYLLVFICMCFLYVYKFLLCSAYVVCSSFTNVVTNQLNSIIFVRVRAVLTVC